MPKKINGKRHDVGAMPAKVVEEIRAAYANGESINAIHRAYNVSWHVVQKLVLTGNAPSSAPLRAPKPRNTYLVDNDYKKKIDKLNTLLMATLLENAELRHTMKADQ